MSYHRIQTSLGASPTCISVPYTSSTGSSSTGQLCADQSGKCGDTFALQHALNTLGYGPLAVDGNLGQATLAAVKSYANDRSIAYPGSYPGFEVCDPLLTEYSEVSSAIAASKGIVSSQRSVAATFMPAPSLIKPVSKSASPATSTSQLAPQSDEPSATSQHPQPQVQATPGFWAGLPDWQKYAIVGGGVVLLGGIAMLALKKPTVAKANAKRRGSKITRDSGFNIGGVHWTADWPEDWNSAEDMEYRGRELLEEARKLELAGNHRKAAQALEVGTEMVREAEAMFSRLSRKPKAATPNARRGHRVVRRTKLPRQYRYEVRVWVPAERSTSRRGFWQTLHRLSMFGKTYGSASRWLEIYAHEYEPGRKLQVIDRYTGRVLKSHTVKRHRLKSNPSRRTVEIDGYAYKLRGKLHWRSAEDDRWDTVLVSHWKMTPVGRRTIDGANVTVLRHRRGGIYAVMSHMLP